MEKQVSGVVEALIENGIIHPSMKDYYIYAATMLVEKSISLATMAVIGLCTDRMMPAILFCLFFMALRKYTGGYHAGSFLVCYTESMAAFTFVLFSGSYLAAFPKIMALLLALSFIVLMFYGTVNHPNMDYSREELWEARKAARYILLLEMLVVCSLESLGVSRQYLCFMKLGIVLCAASVIAAKITKQEAKL